MNQKQIDALLAWAKAVTEGVPAYSPIAQQNIEQTMIVLLEAFAEPEEAPPTPDDGLEISVARKDRAIDLLLEAFGEAKIGGFTFPEGFRRKVKGFIEEPEKRIPAKAAKGGKG